MTNKMEYWSETLLKEALSAMEKAYSPFSKFKVGAALVTVDGNIYTGCNVENASYGLTVCAERVAVLKAVSNGETDIRQIMIVTSAKTPVSPCGACRQVLNEFSIDDMIVGLEGKKEYRLSELLPDSFSGKDFL